MPLITNDAVVFGILTLLLGFIFHTSQIENLFWKKFYSFFPPLLLCYFLPSLLNSFGIISGEHSGLYSVATKFFLPSSLVLLTLDVDFKGLLRLGPKALIIFLSGSIGIIIGGPIALYLVALMFPDVLGGSGPDAVWRGLVTVAGSWIGGAANQTAMKEVFQVSDKVFSQILPVDIFIANIWVAILLYGAGKSEKIDKFLKADSSAIEEVKRHVENYKLSVSRNASLSDIIKILTAAFGVTAVAHFAADLITPYLQTNFPSLNQYSITAPFFWIVIIATTGGLILSFTPARKLEGPGASKFGTMFLYLLVAVIGMKMDLFAVFGNMALFIVGIIWILIHICTMFLTARIIKAPFFFIAVGSQANIGGAASAPIIASAFHPSLATVGVLLAVLGYVLGTYGAWICAMLMQWIFPY